MNIARRALTVAGLFVAGCASVPTTGSHRTATGALAYALTGAGQPTVVLQSGLGDGRAPWAAVVSKLSATHAVFSYDRPGYGQSSATAEARDPCSVATELHGLLGAAGVAPPYVLVGHSLGGLYQYAFARLYPAEVAALVLLDPTHPTHWRRMQADTPATAGVVSGLRATVFSAAMRREFDDQDKCAERLSSSPPLNKPTRLLVRTRFELVEKGAFENMVHTLERDWVSLTGASRVEPIDGSGHYLQKDQPARVVAVIEAVAAALPKAAQ
jgi:pimeloyl-ACP methyl ester carboxylesterase